MVGFVRAHGDAFELLELAEEVFDQVPPLIEFGLERQRHRAPRMLSIGLHTRIIGRPGRIGGLVELLRHMRAKGEVWFGRREDIARHWIENAA